MWDLQVENAYDETRFVKALHAADIPEGEKPLLELARQVKPLSDFSLFVSIDEMETLDGESDDGEGFSWG